MCFSFSSCVNPGFYIASNCGMGSIQFHGQPTTAVMANTHRGNGCGLAACILLCHANTCQRNKTCWEKVIDSVLFVGCAPY